MKKSFMIGLCCLWGAHLFLAISLQAQNWTTVTATNITDLNQQKLAAGQLCFMPTDQNDNPISIGVGGGGQVLRRQYCSQVAAGGLVTAFTVPNPANTLPAGVYYRVTVKDSSTGQEVLRYTQVSFSGTSFNFDNYQPVNLGTPAPLAGTSVTGNLSVTGNVSATGTLTGSNLPANILQQIFDSGTALAQRTGFNCMAGIKCADNAGTSRTDLRLGTLNTLTFSVTPAFDASTASTFKLTLTGNVTSSTLSNVVAGEPLAFEICQDATGGRTFVPPANVQGWVTIPSAANACVLETFIYDGANAVADGDTAGQVLAQDGAAATPSITFENATNRGFYNDTAQTLVGFVHAGVERGGFNSSLMFFPGYNTNATGILSWSGSSNVFAAADTGISRTAAATLAFGNGTQGNSGGSMIANVWAQSGDAGATQHARLQPTGVAIGSADTYLISSTTNASASADTGISRTGAAKIGFGNGTNGNTSATMEGRAVQLDGSTSGSVTLAVPAAAGANTATFPAATGNVVLDSATQTLTNKTIDSASANTIKINGNTLSAAAGAATVTIPAATDTLVGRATTDTLTNKTLNGTGSGNSVTLLNVQGPIAALVGNSGDQTVYTFTIPANTVQAGKGIRIKIVGFHSTGTAVSNYKIIIGATTTATVSTSSGNSENWTMSLYNAAGVQNSQFYEATMADGIGSVSNVNTFGTAAENFANAVTVRFTFNVANTDQYTGRLFSIELIQ